MDEKTIFSRVAIKLRRTDNVRHDTNNDATHLFENAVSFATDSTIGWYMHTSLICVEISFETRKYYKFREIRDGFR